MQRTIAIAVCLCAVLAGCQAYEPLPLDLDAHEEAWSARDPGGAEVAAYAAELAKLNAPGTAAFDASDGITVDEAAMIALVFNPNLRLARLKARVPLLGANEAGRWEDPQLDFDLLRITESVSNPWILGTSVSFTIPISGRLDVQKDKAFAQADVELRRAYLEEWMTIGRLRSAWAGWTGTTQEIVLIEAYLQDLEAVIAIAREERQASRIGAPELRVLQLEQVTRVGQLDVLRRLQERQELGLKAIMGLTPDAELTFLPSLTPAPVSEDAATRRAALREHNLQLAVIKAEYEVSDHAFRLEIRKQYPDLVIGPAYENEDDMSRVGAVLSLPLPLLNQNRRAIAETRAARDAAKAAYEAEYETLVGELALAESNVTAAKARSAFLEDNVAPMVDQQMTDLRRLARLGDLDVLVVLDALTRAHETKVQVLAARVEEDRAVNTLHLLLRPITTPQPLPVEETPEEENKA